MFKYIDAYGQTKYVYSWRLDKNDSTPAGRQRDLSLREKEKRIEADLFDQIVPDGGKLTVLDLVKNRGKMEVQNFQSAIKAYMNGKDKDLSKLMMYADTLKVRNAVMRYVEVLI